MHQPRGSFAIPSAFEHSGRWEHLSTRGLQLAKNVPTSAGSCQTQYFAGFCGRANVVGFQLDAAQNAFLIKDISLQRNLRPNDVPVGSIWLCTPLYISQSYIYAQTTPSPDYTHLRLLRSSVSSNVSMFTNATITVFYNTGGCTRSAYIENWLQC